MTDKSPTIILSEASLRYHGELLFDALSIELSGGKWSCLLGTSGVGKTSLLRLIAGLHSSAIAPRPAHDNEGRSLQGRVSYLAQHPSLFPWLSVIDNILIGEKLRGTKVPLRERSASDEIRGRVRDNKKDEAHILLEQVGLSDYQFKKPHELSGGMKQRAILARTAFENKPIVLLDEPFSALDAITRLKMQELACELFKDKTVVLITHDPLEALRLGDDVYVMAGRPATISDPITPEGRAPRDLMDPKLLTLQGGLLKQLENAMVEEA